LGVSLLPADRRFKLYPKYQQLMDLKYKLIAQRATPPMYARRACML
jgi:hypothetical protein